MRMQLRSYGLTASIARGIGVMCAALFVPSAHWAQAGINVWTRNGPGNIGALVILWLIH